MYIQLIFISIALFGVSTFLYYDITTPKYLDIFFVDATYYKDKQYVEIQFSDSSALTSLVTLEILGLSESYRESFSSHEFVKRVPFSHTPKHGWSIHPLVFYINHAEFGDIQIKTEIHADGNLPPRIIYGK